MASLLEYMQEDQFVEPPAALMLDWLRQHFDTGDAEAMVGAGGDLQLSAEHVWTASDNSVTRIDIRLPPTGPMQPLQDPRRAAWVVQEILFTQAAHMRRLSRKLHECEERCPAEQQFEDLVTFLGSEAAAAAALDSSSGEGGPASPVACRAAHIPSKRKLGSTPVAAGGPAELPPSGSAVKAPRPSGAVQAPEAGAAAGVGSQQTGGMSNSSRLTDVSEVGMARKATGARAAAKRGGRGGGSVMAVGRQRK